MTLKKFFSPYSNCIDVRRKLNQKNRGKQLVISICFGDRGSYIKYSYLLVYIFNYVNTSLIDKAVIEYSDNNKF